MPPSKKRAPSPQTLVLVPIENAIISLAAAGVGTDQAVRINNVKENAETVHCLTDQALKLGRCLYSCLGGCPVSTKSAIVDKYCSEPQLPCSFPRSSAADVVPILADADSRHVMRECTAIRFRSMLIGWLSGAPGSSSASSTSMMNHHRHFDIVQTRLVATSSVSSKERVSTSVFQHFTARNSIDHLLSLCSSFPLAFHALNPTTTRHAFLESTFRCSEQHVRSPYLNPPAGRHLKAGLPTGDDHDAINGHHL